MSPSNISRRSLRHGLFLLCLLCGLSASALAQGPDVTTPQRGFVPGASYALSDIEHINTTNGNVLVNFALGKLPPGRDGLSGAIYLIYNSKLLNTHVEHVPDFSNQISPQNLLGTTLDGSWRYGVRYDLKIINRNDGLDQPFQCLDGNGNLDQRSVYIWKLKMTFPDGSEHLFRPTSYRDLLADGFYNVDTTGLIHTAGGGSGSCSVTTSQDPNSAMTYYSSDGSYLRLTIPHDGSGWTLSFPDGGKVAYTASDGKQRVFDRNNNYFDITGITLPNGHLADKLLDQFGRSSYIEYDTANNQDYIYTTGVSNQQIVWTVKWKTVSTYKNYVTTGADDGHMRGGTSNQTLHGIWRSVDQIIMPTQAGSLTYTFNYNPGTGNPSYGWGEISSITLPSSAQSSYQWLQDGQGPNAPALPSSKDVLASTLTTKTLSWQDEYDGTLTPKSATWQYFLDDTSTLIIDPDGGSYSETHGPSSYVNDDTGLVSAVVRADGSKTERIWQKNLIQTFIHESNPKSDANPYLKTEFTSIKNATGSYSQTSIKDYTYDKDGRVTQAVEYDWVAYSSVPRDQFGKPTGIPGGATIKRVTVNTWKSPVPTATDTTTVSNDSYYQATAPLLRNAIAASEVRSDLSTIVARTESSYDSDTTTGNLTQQKSWDSTKGGVSTPLTGSNSISVSNVYGTFADGTTGRLDQSTDAKSNVTTYTWGDIGNGTTGLYPTTIVVASNAPSIQRTTSK